MSVNRPHYNGLPKSTIGPAIDDIVVSPSIKKFQDAAGITVNRREMERLQERVVRSLRRVATGTTNEFVHLHVGIRNRKVRLKLVGQLSTENYNGDKPRNLSTVYIPFDALSEALPAFRPSTRTPSVALTQVLARLRERMQGKNVMPDAQLSPVMELISEIFPQGPVPVNYPRHNRERAPSHALNPSRHPY